MNELQKEKCKTNLKTIYSIISSSSEFMGKFKNIWAIVSLILKSISEGKVDEVKGFCKQLKEEALEYNGDSQTLDLKDASKKFANSLSGIQLKDCNDLNEFLTADFDEAEYRFWFFVFENNNADDSGNPDNSDNTNSTNSESSSSSLDDDDFERLLEDYLNQSDDEQNQSNQAKTDGYSTNTNWNANNNADYQSASFNSNSNNDGKTSCWHSLFKFVGICALIVLAFKFVPNIWSFFNKKDLRYVIAESGILRSRPTMESSSIIRTYGFGRILECKDADDGWVKTEAFGTKGYMAAQLLVNKSDFAIFSSIFGSIVPNEEMQDARKSILQIKYRRALLSYFKTHSMIGEITAEEAKNFDVDLSKIGDTNYWKVVKRSKGSGYDNVLYDDANDMLAVIIENIKTSKRKTLVFGEGDNICASFLYEEDAPNDGGLKSLQVSGDTYVIKYATKKSVKKSKNSYNSKKSNIDVSEAELSTEVVSATHEEVDPDKGGFHIGPTE